MLALEGEAAVVDSRDCGLADEAEELVVDPVTLEVDVFWAVNEVIAESTALGGTVVNSVSVLALSEEALLFTDCKAE